MKAWLQLSLNWDGILPFVVTAIPFLVSCFAGEKSVARIMAVFFVPMIAAVIRGPIGEMQIAEICGSQPRWPRELAMGLAIAMLLIFDTLATIWIVVPVETPGTLLPAAAAYVAYLILVTLALAPSATRRHRAGS